ncbi:hypothetical protein [Caldovatus aquaticus]|uniref:Uncharacterized protein n=1 Tax=Caldovatus aquaticus TaxID=2865671 RepID=A0ABS7F108_9PROT|nr:hypothetical protein [Caldovatus aquaticus]MBW8269008.1 hypothetical protein [Caldovatus aquaticus]
MTVPHAPARQRADTETLAVPDGFVPRPAGGGALRNLGPIHTRHDAGGGVRHGNPMDNRRGGTLATFAGGAARTKPRARAMPFVQGLFASGGAPVPRASGAFRLPPPATETDRGAPGRARP